MTFCSNGHGYSTTSFDRRHRQVHPNEAAKGTNLWIGWVGQQGFFGESFGPKTSRIIFLKKGRDIFFLNPRKICLRRKDFSWRFWGELTTTRRDAFFFFMFPVPFNTHLRGSIGNTKKKVGKTDLTQERKGTSPKTNGWNLKILPSCKRNII